MKALPLILAAGAAAFASGTTAQRSEGARTAIGVWQHWGAFREGAPPRCFALSAPVARSARGARAYASVLARFGRTGRAALFFRLSRRVAPGGRVTLAIGERRFGLSARGTAAWAPDAPTDRAIVAAMRGARSMSISAADSDGRPFADTYALPGAATAIDAAMLACARG